MKLVEYLHINKERIDLFEPPEGHFDRFLAKQKHNKSFRWEWIARIAGVLLLAALVTQLFVRQGQNETSILPVELQETAFYYDQKSQDLIKEIDEDKSMSGEEKLFIMNDLQTMDMEYCEIISDLKNYPDDERIINAFIEFHKSKTEFLENIVDHINHTNLISQI
ncbi:MAG: hypothetical protein H6538_05010 [Bacteroidales bacterium]|nr:hypothetical protein [Bacteroidales bacterium]MCB8998863.1 hypothetical protein [Bacteroidales bacterium]MCB9013998.1 hypothetical protein [Bacteroidales bacterium]